ncbi:MAG: hypothetical protein LBQ12_03440, partial [Deltaproteobacteria bacterium]|nr:hypothetical protein [Deltaproteobacteria bacterium]
MLKKFFLVILLFFLAVAAGVALLALAWIRQWSPWIALAGPGVFLFVPFCWYLSKLVSSVFARRRYADTVLGRGTGLPDAASEGSALRRDWERGLAALSPPGRSQVSDPARGFPWLLVLGPQGAGRHGILRGAGPPLNPDPEAPLEGPEGASWYFFENAVYVAVRGLFDRYPEKGRAPAARGAAEQRQGAPPQAAALPGAGLGAAPSAPGSFDAAAALGQAAGGAEDARAGLCALLRESGRRVPLQGAVLSVPAELFGTEREAELRDLAFQTGQLLDRMADELDFAPPLYVFVTGLHLEPGWEAALDRLSREGAVLGAMFEADERQEGLAAEAAGAIRSGIRDLVVEAMDSEPGDIAPFLAAPAAAEALQRPLSVLLGVLQNPAAGSVRPKIMGLFVSLPAVSADAEAPSPEGAAEARLGGAAAGQGAARPAPEASGGAPGVAPPFPFYGFSSSSSTTNSSSSSSSSSSSAAAAAGAGTGGDGAGGTSDGQRELAAAAGTAASVLAAAGGLEKPGGTGPAGAAAAAALEPKGPGRPAPVTGGASERLLSETLPGMGYLSRRINRSGAKRQRKYVLGLLCLYSALLAAAYLVGRNVEYQRGASAEAEEFMFAYAAAHAGP